MRLHQEVKFIIHFLQLINSPYQIKTKIQYIDFISNKQILIFLVEMFLKKLNIKQKNIQRSLQVQALSEKGYSQLQKFIYYEKLFFIKNENQRQNALKRHSLQINHIPHFIIVENQKNYLKIQFKCYYLLNKNELSNFFSYLSQALRLTVISQLLTTYASLMAIYEFFRLDRNALRIDESGKLIIWIYTDYQKSGAQKKYTFESQNNSTNFIIRQKQAIKSFLSVFGQFLSNNEIIQSSQLTIKQLNQFIQRNQTKKQSKQKCPTFIKNKYKNQFLTEQTLNLKRNDLKLQSRQVISLLSERTKIKKNNDAMYSERDINDKSLSKTFIKKYLSPNKTFLKINQDRTKIQKFQKCSQNYSFFKNQIKNDSFKKSKRTYSNYQVYHTQENSFRLLINKNIYDNIKTVHKRANSSNVMSPIKFIKFIPKTTNFQTHNFNKKIESNRKRIDNQSLKQISKFKFVSSKKQKHSLSVVRVNDLKLNHLKCKALNIDQKKNDLQIKKDQNHKIQIKQKNEEVNTQNSLNQIKKFLKKSSSTEQLTLQKQFNIQQQSKNFHQIYNFSKSCSNVPVSLIKQLEITTSTVPTLNNCLSNQIINNINSLQGLSIQQQLNQMFSDDTRKSSIQIIDEQKYQQLKSEVQQLLNM